MKVRNALWIIGAAVLCGNGGDALAYDASPRGDVANMCSQVTFSEFMPKPFSHDTNNVEVAPQSAFSFFASKATLQKTITVTIKGERIPITVKPQSNGFLVTGKLPATVTGSYVRIEIMGQGPNQCERPDGWLLKVAK